MTTAAVNIHATAIMVGTAGLLFIGASGSGKSSMAFACLGAAAKMGLFAALIADDRVLLSQIGDHLVAAQPKSIRGLLEVRGTGIVDVQNIEAGLIRCAVAPVSLAVAPRLPIENEKYFGPDGASVPLVSIANSMADPLAVLLGFMPDLSVK